MSRSRAKRQSVPTKCPSPPKKGKFQERNRDPLHNADTSLPFGIKCPKKETTNRFVSIEIKGNRFEKEIRPIIDRSFKVKNKNIFEPKECRDLINVKFESEYATKRNELRQQGASKEATADQYGFLFSRGEQQIKNWCEHGIRSGNAKTSRLGKPNDGVSLAQFADIVCPTNLLPPDGWICIVKYFKGRVYPVQEAREPLEPQPNFDCHAPTTKSNSSWNRGNTDTFYSNQIYLYEYSDESVPTTRPRHVLPFAAVKYKLKHISETKKSEVTRYSQESTEKKRKKKKKKPPAESSKGQTLQQHRADIAKAAIPSIPNPQHPGVPLMCVKPKPPPLISKSVRQLVPIALDQQEQQSPVPVISSSSTTNTCPLVNTDAVKGNNRRSSTENIVPESIIPCKVNNGKKMVVCNSDMKISTNEQNSHSIDKQREEPTLPSVPNQQPKIQEQVAATKPVPTERLLQQRSERPNKNIGIRHHSSGFTVSFLKLKAGDHFQAKMDLVSYADTLMFPLAVLYMRLSPKLSIRKFASMSRLRAVEFQGAEISIKEEFFCPGCNRYASYYRLYVRRNRVNVGTDSAVEFRKLCDYMKQRESVAIVHFANESQEMLMFPESEFARGIEIPQLENESTSNPWYLHCLLLSKEPKKNYYTRLLHKPGDVDDQVVDSVLSTYIWGDAEMPPYDAEEAEIRGSYGGEWASEEAVDQVFEGENNIQHQCLLQSLGRRTSAGHQPIAYQQVKFYRRCDTNPAPPLSVDNVTTEMLQSWLDNVAAQERRRSVETEDNGRKKLEAVKPTVPAASLTPPEPKSVKYAKRVFEEPPASPVKMPSAGPPERAVLAEMNPHAKEKLLETAREMATAEASPTNHLASSIHELQKALDQHAINSIGMLPKPSGVLPPVSPNTSPSFETSRSKNAQGISNPPAANVQEVPASSDVRADKKTEQKESPVDDVKLPTETLIQKESQPIPVLVQPRREPIPENNAEIPITHKKKTLFQTLLTSAKEYIFHSSCEPPQLVQLSSRDVSKMLTILSTMTHKSRRGRKNWPDICERLYRLTKENERGARPCWPVTHTRPDWILILSCDYVPVMSRTVVQYTTFLRDLSTASMESVIENLKRTRPIGANPYFCAQGIIWCPVPELLDAINVRKIAGAFKSVFPKMYWNLVIPRQIPLESVGVLPPRFHIRVQSSSWNLPEIVDEIQNEMGFLNGKVQERPLITSSNSGIP